jgi:hypothetical protein
MPGLNPQNYFGQFYSVYKSNELKNLYEKENNFIYDIVIRIRFGMVVDSGPIYLHKYYSEHIMFVPVSFCGFDARCNPFINDISFCDHWAIGSSSNMNIYCDVVNQAENIVMHYPCHLQGEDVLGYWVRVLNKINIALIDIKYRINTTINI